MTATYDDKVRNITEVCNVSRDEAVRVLDACRMDEAMAIERFLTGKGVSVWSEVSKKKKTPSRPSHRSFPKEKSENNQNPPIPPTTNSYRNSQRRTNRSAPQKTKNTSSSTSSRRHPPALQEHTNGHNSTTPIARSKEANSPEDDEKSTWRRKARAPHNSHPHQSRGWEERARKGSGLPSHTAEDGWEEEPSRPREGDAWALRGDGVDALDRADTGADQGPTEEIPSKTTVQPSSRNHRRDPTPATAPHAFNYAAAVAAGTSHAKYRPRKSADDQAPMTEITPQKDTGLIVAAEVAEHLEGPGSAEKKERHSSSVADDTKPSTSLTPPFPMASYPEATPKEADAVHGMMEQTPSVPPIENEETDVSPSVAQNVWKIRSEVASEGAVSLSPGQTSPLQVAEPSPSDDVERQLGDSLSLQFGSLGLNGLEGVNWSTSNVKPTESFSPAPEEEKPAVISKSPPAAPRPTKATLERTVVDAAAEVPAPAPVTDGNTGALNPESILKSAPSVPAPSVSGSKSSSSGMFPVLPVGPGANYPPTNYGAPYLVPQLHGYSPAMGSFEGSGDVGSSRSLNAGPPGSLSLYDPATLPTMANGNGKFAGIPGLGDISATPPIPNITRKEFGQDATEIDQGTSLASSSLPAGVDPLPAPYLLPGYPSIQYPMYAFPNAPYPGPPGMATAGPSPFPYPHSGQVPPTQNSRGGFGFEDSSVNLGRTRSNTGTGDSVYTPGAYVPSSHSNAQKLSNDAPYKQMRGGPQSGSSQGPMGLAGGVVHGVPYSEYSPSIGTGTNNTFTGNGGTPVGWSSRDGGTVRPEDHSGSRPVGHAGSQNSTLYPSGPGAPTGYWAMQGGYYP